MPRLSIHEPLYEIFTLFKENCLKKENSILWPELNVWTVENLELWKKHVIENPIIGSDLSADQKFEKQFETAPQKIWLLAAELHYIYYLPSSNILFTTKFKKIKWAAESGGMTIPPETDPIWEYQKQGFSRTAQKYHFRYNQLQLLVIFSLKLKEQPDIEKIVDDPKSIQAMLDGLLESFSQKSERAYDMRHAILYLMFPDFYEPTISTTHKEKMINKYGSLVTNPTSDIDSKIFQIRQELAKEHPNGINFNFYEDEMMKEWLNIDEPVLTPIPSPLLPIGDKPDTDVSDQPIINKTTRLLKLYKNLILYGPPGTGKTYWADKIAKKLIEPQLKQSQSETTFFQTIIEGLTFYDILALTMYKKNPDGKYFVKELQEDKLIQSRFALNPVKNQNSNIWGYLQAHTDPEYLNVKIALRNPPYLFNKTEDAKWFLTENGKEYVQDNLADQLTSINIGPPRENLPENFIRWITFHQSYSYEDFVEGLRPVIDPNETGQLSFEMKIGVFRNLCVLANNDSENTYILIIDEINRGNIAKIFGELMTLIEANKRSNLSVELPYSKEKLTIPENLLIIGTMNSSDRSIALLDLALRRRFAFYEVLPEPDLLDEITISTVEDTLKIGALLQNLNKRIVGLVGVDYQVGHSYFMPLGIITNDQEKLLLLEDIWNYQIFPLLREYFYGQNELLKQIIPSFFDPDNEEVESNDEALNLFGDDLISALNQI